MLTRLIERRRALHRIPETEYDTVQTRAYILSVASRWNAKLFDVARNGVVAFFDLGKEDTYAFRSDMDALRVEEATGAKYQSRFPGRMHACGHDGHMAMLLALGDWIDQNRDGLSRNALLVFQPAEESGGGGRAVARSGILQACRASRAYALHVDPMLPLGVIASRPGAFMARSSEVHARVYGRAAHAARAWEGRDALMAAAHFLTRAKASEAALPESVMRLVKFGILKAGSAVNVIADEAQIGGTMRTFDDAVFSALSATLRGHARDLEGEYGVRFELDIGEGYPALINDEALFCGAQRALAGFDFLSLDQPSMLAEDFAFYREQLPILMLYVGLGTGIALHTGGFVIDEAALLVGARALIALMDAP